MEARTDIRNYAAASIEHHQKAVLGGIITTYFSHAKNRRFSNQSDIF